MVKKRTPQHYTWVGRVVTILAGLLGLVFAFNVERLGGIIKANYQIMSFFEPPIFVVVLAALFWRRATASGAVACLLGGTAYNAVAAYKFGHSPADRTFVVFPVCLVIMVAVSLLTRIPESKQDQVRQLAERMAPGPLNLKTPRVIGGILVSSVSLILFVLGAIFEETLPKPGNILFFLILVTTFVLGIYILLPDVIGRDPTVTDPESADLEACAVNRLFSSAWTWGIVFATAAVLMVLLYLL